MAGSFPIECVIFPEHDHLFIVHHISLVRSRLELLGRVDTLLKAKGFGFIQVDVTRYFFHPRNVLPRYQFNELVTGDVVTFDEGVDDQGRTQANGVQCARVQALYAPTEDAPTAAQKATGV